MCGICGIINFSQNRVREDKIRGMMKQMKHRGPDDEGVYIENNLGFGFVRLSIIDLTTAGHQPMVSEDGKFVLVFNGEIYNYIEIREELISKGYTFKSNSDSEVLLKAYIQWEEECLPKFNGMWSFVIYDRSKNTIFCARDRFGVKPFYYYQSSEAFIFASEIPAILSILENSAEPDEQSIYDYLVFNRTDQTESTFFKGIKKLQHGHKIIVKDYDFSIQRWYDLKTNLKNSIKSPADYKDIFTSSLNLRLRSDVPVGVCLSGGLDSSSIVSVLVKDFHINNLNTFSALYGKGIKGDESDFINLYKPMVKNMFFTYPSAETLFEEMSDFARAHGEPVPTTSPYAQFKVMELASKHVVVTLDGQGADEELAGYHYFFGFYFKELLKELKFHLLFDEAFHYLKNQKSLFGIKTFLFFLLPEFLMNNLRVAEKGYVKSSFSKKFASSNNITGNLYKSDNLQESLLNHFEYKLEHLLKFEDRNSMVFSLEARVPFLDYRLVEGTLALPSDKLIHNGTTKHILREAMRGRLPEQIRNRMDKIGFETPSDKWFREKIFYNYIEELLLKNESPINNYIDTKAAWSIYLNHLDNKVNIGNEIWKWINLDLWFKFFIMNNQLNNKK